MRGIWAVAIVMTLSACAGGPISQRVNKVADKLAGYCGPNPECIAFRANLITAWAENYIPQRYGDQFSTEIAGLRAANDTMSAQLKVLMDQPVLSEEALARVRSPYRIKAMVLARAWAKTQGLDVTDSASMLRFLGNFGDMLRNHAFDLYESFARIAADVSIAYPPPIIADVNEVNA